MRRSACVRLRPDLSQMWCRMPPAGRSNLAVFCQPAPAAEACCFAIGNRHRLGWGVPEHLGGPSLIQRPLLKGQLVVHINDNKNVERQSSTSVKFRCAVRRLPSHSRSLMRAFKSNPCAASFFRCRRQVMTGVFCNSAIKAAERDHDMVLQSMMQTRKEYQDAPWQKAKMGSPR